MAELESVDGKTCVITGAASGIGLAIALAAARRGAKIVLADIDRDSLDKAESTVSATGARAASLCTDVTKEADVERLADYAFEQFGAVHVLCNNAGIALSDMGRIFGKPQASGKEGDTSSLRSISGLNIPLAWWRRVVDVNFWGVVHGIKSFLPRMIRSGEPGHIVNTASVAGLYSVFHPYNASKHAVVCVTEGLYKDLRCCGMPISASVLCPGGVATGILRHSPDRQSDAPAPQSGVDTLQPEDIAEIVLNGITEDRFYLVPSQPKYLELITSRVEDVAQFANPRIVSEFGRQ